MKKTFGSLFMGDRVIWFIFFLLCAVSLVEVFSAVSTLSYKSGNFWAPIGQHATYLGVGAVVCWAIHRIECRWFRALPVLLYGASILMLFYTTVFGAVVNDASRWMSFFGLFQFQPSEIAKCAVVMVTAMLLSSLQTEDGADKRAMKYILWAAVPICVLIFMENLSTAAILFTVVFLMMYVGRVPLVQLGKLLGVIILTGAIVGSIVYGVAKSDTDHKLGELPLVGKVFHRAETWIGRFEAKAGDEDADPLKYDIENKAQVAHANIAIANSNIVGRAPGNSVERDFLSQAFSDFIFAIIIEETGVEGAFFVLSLYIFLLFRVGQLASRCERTFAPFLAMGLALLLVTQAMVNMAVAVGLMPVTGQPLPLISRGGTSTIINCFYIGMILSVSRYARQSSHPEHTSFDAPLRGVKHEEVKSATVPAEN